MHRLKAHHILRALRSGSSSPVVVETEGGKFVLKLRGAAQGVRALVAELVVSALAERLGLPVPERAIVELADDYVSDDLRDELDDLLRQSVGLNVGFRLLSGAVDLRAQDLQNIDSEFAATTLWLDGLAMNVDRTLRNPNVLKWQGALWLIDNGASLPFQHWWSSVTEQDPRIVGFDEGHIFASYREHALELDQGLAAILTRECIEEVLDSVPSELLSDVALEGSVSRTRAAYAAFIWKRRGAQRPFL